MWNRFFKTTYQKVSFEDIQFCIQHHEDFLLINTMPLEEQGCLIEGTISFQREEIVINEFINQYDYNRRIILYGKNTLDTSVEQKYDQLIGFGFSHVYIYTGGMFEWMLLQDIYGNSEFPTTTKVLDILKFKPTRSIGTMRIQY